MSLSKDNDEPRTSNPAATCPERLSTRWAAFMFWLAVVFLVLVAWLISIPEQGVPPILKVSSMTVLTGILWIFFILEVLVRFVIGGERSWQGAGRAALVALLPPYRMGMASDPSGKCLWLPRLGWQAKGPDLYAKLERIFSLPMVFIALLILPILALEFLWQDRLTGSRFLTLILHHGSAVIWLAFAIELVLLSSVAQDKLRFLLGHWLNILIVLLPVIAFLRSLQLFRVLRLTRIGRMIKVFRVRGVLIRAWRALVVLNVLDRLTRRDVQKRLAHLRGQLAEKEREVEQLRERVRRTEEEVERAGLQAGIETE